MSVVVLGKFSQHKKNSHDIYMKEHNWVVFCAVKLCILLLESINNLKKTLEENTGSKTLLSPLLPAAVKISCLIFFSFSSHITPLNKLTYIKILHKPWKEQIHNFAFSVPEYQA